jgi:hypothetical protein
MTKFLLSCLIACIVVSADAQIKKNAILLGADFNFTGQKSSNNHDDKWKYLHSDINISIGKAVKQNAVIGLNLGFTPYWTKFFPADFPDSSVKSTSTSYSVGTFYRQYKSLAKDLYFFTNVNADYSHAGPFKTSSKPVNEFKTINNTAHVALATGISYRFYKKLYVEATVNIVSVTYSDTRTSINDQSLRNTSFNFATLITRGNTLNALSLGFRFVI